MTFTPPYCPNVDCPCHVVTPRQRLRTIATTPFFLRKGSFLRADEDAIARFRCRECGRHFSEQTFRQDYRQKRTDVNERLAQLRSAGRSIRAAARLLGIDRKTASRRFRWLGGLQAASRGSRELGPLVIGRRSEALDADARLRSSRR